MTVGSRGITKTVGLPGTGIYYTSRAGYHTGYHSAVADAPRSPEAQGVADRSAERTLGLLVIGVLLGLALALLIA